MRNHCARMDDRRSSTAWTATGHERPVFFDERGRRRRWVLGSGVFAGALAGGGLAALVAGAIGFSTLPSLSALPLSLAKARPHQPVHQLLAVRGPARTSGHALAGHAPSERLSGVERAAELAVSHGLLVAR